MFFQGRPSTSQDDHAIPADVLQGPLDELDFPDQARPRMMPSTSTPNGHVQRPNIGRGGPRGVVTRSTARYLSTCLYLSLYLIVPFVSGLIRSNLI